MLFWRRQRRVTAWKRERLREGIEEMRAWTASISPLSRG
jgi:hypothetical protein